MSERNLAYQKLYGNPRCAQFLLAIVRHSEAGITIHDLLTQVEQVNTRDVPRRLAEILVQDLSDRRRAVLQVLAAFTTPADARTVAAASSEPISEQQAAGILTMLAEETELVRSLDDDRYYLELTDVQWLLPRDHAQRLTKDSA
jgi:hypothetical protein